MIDFTIPQEGYISNDFILRTSNELGEFVKSILFVLVTAGALCCHAQQPATDPAMSRFFGGNWSCAGEFASGKKIEADCSLNWVDPDFGKRYCFSSATSLVYFLNAPRSYLARARKNWIGLSRASR